MKVHRASKSDTAEQYWDVRSELFANYYKKPSLFDRVFRKPIYKRAAIALAEIQKYEHPTVLDIGCGPGINSINWLKNSNASFLLGIDFAESMIEYAKKNSEMEHVSHRCQFVVDDFMDHDFQNQVFDVSVAVGVFDYVDNAGSFLEKMVRVSDKAIVASWPKNGLRMALRRYRYTCPVYHYDEDEIIEMHKLAGITEIHFASSSRSGCMTIGRKAPAKNG